MAGEATSMNVSVVPGSMNVPVVLGVTMRGATLSTDGGDSSRGALVATSSRRGALMSGLARGWSR